MSQSNVARVNDWLVSQPWRLWRNQATAIFSRELKKMLRRRLWLWFLGFAPVVIIGIHALTATKNDSFEEDTLIFAGIMQFYYLRLAIFFGSMGIFTWLFRGEMAEKSLHYYFLSPLRREVLVVGKFLAGCVASVIVFSSATIISWYLMFSHHGAAGKAYMTGPGLVHVISYVAATAFACVAYGALFLGLSLLVKNPILPAFLILGWEGVATVLPAFLQKMTIAYYLKNLCPIEVPVEGIFLLFTVVAEPVHPAVAVVGLVFLTIAFLIFACWRVRHLQISYTTD